MVEIKPFKGIRYNQEKIKDFNLVITPPYDVINEKEQQEFYALSEHNMVKLILGEKHEEAAKSFKEWQENDVFKIEDNDSIYIYSQTFSYNENTFTRTGFISLIKLEDLGKGVLPHEKTLEKPFKDRLDLIENTKANFGSVFLLYDDRKKVVDSLIKDMINNKEPDIGFKDKFEIEHKLWKISDEEFINKLKQEMLQYQCIIADGHHRYKSVMAFKDENPELKDAKSTMCCFINSFNEGLFILPIDRFVFNLENADIDNILSKLKEYFEIEEIEDVNELIKKVDNTPIMLDKTINLKNHVFGMYCYLNKSSYFLKLKDNNILDKYYPDDTDVYKKLDVNILHKIIFENILNISEEDQYRGTHIEYTKGSKRALHKLEDNKYQFAFFLNAPLMREIFLTARANETMPQKSTYFYPKVYSGLVINKIK
jgi:uncharacterized protein (DUF1015 family)